MAGILADSMAYELRHDRPTNWTRSSAIVPTWNASFAYIVLFVKPSENPSGVPRLIDALAQDIDSADAEWSPLDAFSHQIRTLGRCGPDWPARSLLFFAQSLKLLKARNAERCLARVAHASFVDQEGRPNRDTYRRLLVRTRLDTLVDDAEVVAPTPQRLVALLEVARVILHKCALDDTGNRDGFPAGIMDLLTFVLDAVPIVNRALPDVDLRKSLTTTTASEEPGLYRALITLFTTPHTIHPLFFFFTLNPRHLLIPTDASYHDRSFPDLVSTVICSQDESMSIVSHCASFFETYKIKLQQVDRSTILRLCSLTWKITVIVIDDETRAGWHSMLAAAAACVSGVQMRTGFKLDDGHTDTVYSHDVAADTPASGQSSLRRNPKVVHELDDVADAPASPSEAEETASATITTSIAPVTISLEETSLSTHTAMDPSSNLVHNASGASVESD
ncbi:hypothetical protein EIP86_006592 [Pleurotus ostreatoroseus]|nr:hypothetical protein EIP86_006592 [Pleurotus ostreatoroseus]